MICPACQQSVPESNRFCGQCGQAMVVDSLCPQTSRNSKTRLGRRYVTALFTDIVNSTRLVKMFDPEELQRIMQIYQNQATQVVNDFGGRIIEIQGDGIVAIFSGQENATESAVHAGYDLVQSILQLRAVGPTSNQTKLHTRVGIAFGAALVNAAKDNQPSLQVVGTANYLASRLQGFANEDEVVVCPEIHKRTKGFFEYTRLTESRLKGFAEVENVWKVEQANDTDIRFDARHQLLTPLIGREEVMSSLLSRWEQSLEKHGQVVLLRGEAGIGKSRVVAEFVQCIKRRTPAHVKLNYQCSQFAKDVPLYPLMKQITLAIDIKKQDHAEQIESKLIALLESWQVSSKHYKGLLMPLVHNTQKSPGATSELSDTEIDLAIKACTQLPIFFSYRTPVLVVVEDMHFADDASKQLLVQSIQRAKRARIMIVVTARSEFELLGSKQDYVTEIPLKRLAKRKALELLKNVKFDQQLPQAIRQDILEKSDGVPLHIEELALHLSESLANGSGNTTTFGLKTPATLFDSFIERFDRYPDQVQRVARAAAAIGREFDHRILSPVLKEQNVSVCDALDMLEENEQVYRIGDGSNYFIFKHALLRDAIYDNTLNQEKYRLHKGVVDHLSATTSRESIITIKQIDYHQRMVENYAEYS